MIERFKVEGHSMEPALGSGEYFLVSKVGRPRVKDIVVIKHPEKNGMYLVKRIVHELPNNFYIVAGDNVEHSEDSRKFGAINRDRIVGKLSFCYWPLKKFGFIKKAWYNFLS